MLRKPGTSVMSVYFKELLMLFYFFYFTCLQETFSTATSQVRDVLSQYVFRRTVAMVSHALK